MRGYQNFSPRAYAAKDTACVVGFKIHPKDRALL